MASPAEYEILNLTGREVQVSNPRKVLFPTAGHTKLDVVRYYVAVADGALRAAGGRPNMLLRFPNGIDGESFYQKRAPESRPPWVEVVELSFPSAEAAIAKKSPSTNLLRESAVRLGPSGNRPVLCQSMTAPSASTMTSDLTDLCSNTARAV